jgi:hypothetical protein
MSIDPDEVEAVALRVAELLGEQGAAAAKLVDAASLAQMLGVKRRWVYARASELGAIRLGDGPRAPLRFDARRVRETLARAGTRPRPAVPSAERPSRARARGLPPGVKPVRARPSR